MFKSLLSGSGRRSRKQPRRGEVSRRRRGRLEMSRMLQAEILEDRRLLASEVVIGLSDVGIVNRTIDGNEVTYQAVDASVEIDAARIVNDLNNGLNVTVTTESGAAGNGDLIIVNNVVKNDPRDVTLSLVATESVEVLGVAIQANMGTLSVVINSNRDLSGSGYVAIASSTVATGGGDLTIGGQLDPSTSPAAGTPLQPQGVFISAGALLDAGGGNVSIRGDGVDGGGTNFASGVLVSESSIQTSVGSINVVGTGGDGAGEANTGVSVVGSTVVTVSGGITVVGTGQGTGDFHDGVFLSESAVAVPSVITTTNGAISVSGTGSPVGGILNAGLILQNGANRIESLGTGSIDIVANGGRLDVGGTVGIAAGLVAENGTDVIGGATAAGPISIRANDIELDQANIDGAGDLTIATIDPDARIDLGVVGGSGGQPYLELTDQELGSISDGFASLTFGDAANGSGEVNIDSVTLTDPVTIVGGSIQVDNGLTGDGGIALTARDAATMGQNVTINSGTVTDASGDVIINAGDDFTLVSGAAVNAPGAGALVVVTLDAPDADVGTGSVASLAGPITSGGNRIFVGGPDQDSIAVSGTLNSIGMTSSGSAAGTLTLDGVALSYNSVESITSTATVNDVSLTFSANEDVLSVTQPVANQVQVQSTGSSFTMSDTAGSLSIFTGTGADTVNVSALGVALPGGLFIQDSDAAVDDTVNVDGAFSNSVGGLEIGALNVDLNADIDVDDALIIGDPVATGSITVAAANIVSTGVQQYLDAVTFTSNLTSISAPGGISFAAELDGAVDLAINADNIVDFASAIGGTTPLASLSINSAGSPILTSGDITTTGGQVYDGPVVVDGAPGLAISSQAGAIVFNSTLDESVADVTDLTISSAGITTFAASVGSTARLRSLAVTTGGPFVAPSSTTLNDISFSVTDAAAAGDDLSVPAAATLVSAAGNVTLAAGDSISVDPAATIDAIAGSLAVNVDPQVGDADDEGGTVAVAGIFSLGAGMSIAGGNDADTFTVIDLGLNYSIDGGDPDAQPGDVVNVDAGGRRIGIGQSQLRFGTIGNTIDLSGIELINLTNSNTIDVNGTATDDTFTVNAEIASPLDRTTLGTGLAITYDRAASFVSVDGGAGNDSLIYDISNGIPGFVEFSGGLSVSPLDQIIIQGTNPVGAIEFEYLSENDGFVRIDGTTIGYVNIAPLTSTITADDVVLNYSGVAETIDVTQVGTDVTVDSTTGEITTFAAPTTSLTINPGGGTDIINISGIDLPSDLTIDDPDAAPDDTVNFDTSPTTVAGVLDIDVQTTNINQSLNVGDLFIGVLNIPVAGGTTSLGADVTSVGQQQYNEVATLTADATLAGDSIIFRNTLDGAFNLVLNDSADAVNSGFGFDVGGTVPLASLTTDAAGGTTISGNVTTTGDQTYGGTQVLVGNNAIQVLSSGGNISLAGQLDAQATAANTDFQTSSIGTLSLAGPVGSVTPMASLTSVMAGPFTAAANITTQADLSLTVVDSAADTDDLTISNGAALTSNTSSVSLTAGDEIEIQSAATIDAQGIGVSADRGADPDVGTGATVSVLGSLSTVVGTTISTGTDADLITVRPQAGTDFAVDGDEPTQSPGDALSLDAGGADVSIDTATGTIVITGAQPVTPTNIEALSLQNVGTLTLGGDVLADSVTLASDPNVVGGDLLTINGRAPLGISGVTSLVYDGSGGDDVLTFDASVAMPTTPVTFNGQGQDFSGVGDRLTLLGTFGTQTFNYSAPGTDGNSGTVDLDGTVITYTGLEPIDGGDSADTVLNFNTGLANNATLADDAAAGLIGVVDGGATFEDTFFPVPTNSLTINLSDLGDTLQVNTLDPTYAASLIVVGGAGADDVQLNNVTISGTPGRGLDVAGVETLTITASAFNNNTADVGAGLRVIGGTTTINNSTFMGNTATGDASAQGGGGIFADGQITIQNGSLIDSNTASGTSGSGGGILVGPSGTLTVSGSVISGNTANRAGGGIEIQSGNDLTLTAVTLQNNNAGVTPAVAAPGNGGGLHITGDANVSITGGTISGNQAAAEGGGLWNDQGTMIIGGGTLIELNVAAGDLDPAGTATDLQGGGGIFNNGGSLSINSIGGAVTIRNNRASGTTFGSGGGVMSIGGSVAITGALIDANEAVRAGGGVEVIEGTVTIEGTDLTGNDVSTDDLLGAGLAASPGNGGGLHITGAAAVTINGGSVQNNVAQAEGGGLWNSATGTLNLVGVSSIDVSGNEARGDAAPGATGTDVQGGGGIFNNGGTLNISGDAVTPNITISGNAATGTTNSSGGGVLSISGDVSISSAFVVGNEAVRAGGGIEIVAGTINIDATEIDGNDVSATDLLGLGLGASPGNGGGLHVTGTADVTISATMVVNNAAGREGGGLWNNSGTMTINNGTLIGSNTADGDALDDGGGGIFNNGGTLNITGASTVISNNRATGTGGSGGGIFSASDGSVSITDATLTGNTATVDGGGLIAEGNAGTITISGVTIDANVAGDAGGGALINGPTTTIASSILSNNQAQGNGVFDGNGGGLFLGGDTATGTFTITDTSFDGNTALGGGGGAFILNVDGTISGGSANSNQVIGNGTTFETGSGGFAIVGESRVNTVGLTGITVDGNAAPAAAGIGIIDAIVSISNSAITNNTASEASSGGGGIGAIASVALGGNLLSVTASSITGNLTAGEGGGIGILSGDVSITDTTISSNQADGGRGGGIGIANTGLDGTVTIRSTTISANTASDTGGGVAVLNMGIDLENVTISANVAATAGGGLAYDNNVDAVTRSISFTTFTSNTAPTGSNVTATGSQVDVISSIFNDGTLQAPAGVLNSQGNNLDSGNTSGFAAAGDLLDTDPLLGPLQDNGGPVQTHALLIGSPAIDAGGTSGPATDARGTARPVDGDSNGSLLFDIGAVEAEQGLMLVVDELTDIDDGIVTPGNLSIREALRIANTTPGSDTVTFDSGLFASPQVITLSGTRLDVTDSVLLVGPGASQLTLDANQGSQVLGVTGGLVQATVSGLTFTGGDTSFTGGAIDNVDATLTLADSVVSGNRAAFGGGINNEGGSLSITGSTITGNYATGTGGGVNNESGSLSISDTTISYNTAIQSGGGIHNSMSASLTVTRSTIAGNAGVSSGGGIESTDDSSASVENSTISGNTTNGIGGGFRIGGYAGTDSASIVNATITGNTAGYGAGVAVGDSADLGVTISNSVVAGNSTTGSPSLPSDILARDGSFSAGGTLDLAGSLSNLIGDPATSGGLADGVNGNIVGDGSGGVRPIDTILNTTLADNGGPTQTHALVSGSVAIDNANPTLAPSVDQRGFPRPLDGDGDTISDFDIGAVEFQLVVDLIVDNTSDVDDGDFSPGNLSLREAVRLANADPNADTITFDPVVFGTPQTITLAGTRLDLTEDVIISGPGSSLLTISGNDASQIFRVEGVGTEVTISDMTVTQGLGEQGGAIENVDAILIIQDAVISESTAGVSTGGRGGGIFNGGTLTITRATISGNTAQLGPGPMDFADGGGIFNASLTSINDSSIVNNAADTRGGGLMNDGPSASLTIANTTIASNTADIGGGIVSAIISGAGSISITDSVITGNSANQAAGGLLNSTSGIANVTGSTVSDNYSGDFGGGIANFGQLTIADSTISRNTAVAEGGGIHNLGDSSAGDELSVTGTTIAGNEASGGGGLSVRTGTVTVSNSTISGNTGGGGVRIGANLSIPGSNVNILNTTITGNSALSGSAGLGVYQSADDGVTLANSIVAGNSLDGGTPSDIQLSGATLAVAISNLIGDPASSGGIADGVSGNIVGDGSGGVIPIATVLDPSLADNGGPTQTHALVAGSPAIDRANATLAPAQDQRGLPRPFDGDGDTIADSDIGAVERQQAPQTVALVIDDVTVAEDVGTATISVLLPSDVLGGFTVEFATSDGAATQPDDYTAASGTLTFAGTAGETQTFTVPIVEDLVVEPLESFNVSLANPSSVIVDASDTAVVTISDNDVAVLTIAAITVDEGIGSAVVNVVVDNAVDGGFTVSFATSDGTAIQPDDYTSVTGTLTFAGIAGESQSFLVPIIDDAISEVTETINVGLSNPSNPAVDASGTGVISITDNDVPTGGIDGHVFCDLDRDGVRDPGEAVVGTLVYLDTNDNGRFDAGEPNTTTDIDGFYEFTGLVESEVELSVGVDSSCNALPEDPRVELTDMPVGNLARSIISLDIDGDQDQDLVVASDQTNALSVLRNTGDGFEPAPDIVLSSAAEFVRARSLAGFQRQQSFGLEVKIAVAAIGTPSSGGQVFEIEDVNASTPIELAVATSHPGTAGPIDVVLDDLDNDGSVDTLAASFRDSVVNVYWGDSTEETEIDTLAEQILSVSSGELVGGPSTREFAVSSFGFGKDTRLEVYSIDDARNVTKVASANSGPSTVQVALENVIEEPGTSVDEIVQLRAFGEDNQGKLVVYSVSGGSITKRTETDVSRGASSFAFGDFNADGKRDVAIANLGGQFIELYTGTGDGQFALVTTVHDVAAPSSLVVDDFTGDGFGEIAVTNLYSDANINDPSLDPDFTLPSRVTVIQLETASEQITVVPDQVARKDFRFPLADPEIILDTNNDGRVSALDALRVINVLSRQSAAEGEQAGQVQQGRAATDVNGDGRTSAIDALMIINYLGRESLSGEAELYLNDLVGGDDDDERDERIEAIDLALTRGLN